MLFLPWRQAWHPHLALFIYTPGESRDRDLVSDLFFSPILASVC